MSLIIDANTVNALRSSGLFQSLFRFPALHIRSSGHTWATVPALQMWSVATALDDVEAARMTRRSRRFVL